MTAARPLTGIRVLELGAYISGPYAGSILASLGADVVKVESPGGDAFRRGVGIESPYFVQYNSGKRSIAVNLKEPEGLEVIKALLPEFDVLIENSRPGKTAALGLGVEECLKINPKLIYSSVSGFGDGGEWRDRAAYDSMGQSMGGYYSVMNEAGRPALTGTCVGDLVTALSATMGILAALVGRGLDPQGRGSLTETSLLEAMSMLTIDAMTQYHETGEAPTLRSRHPQAQNFCLLTATGESITLHLSSSEKFWRALARAMDRPELIEDPRFLTYKDRVENYFDLLPIVEEAFRQHDAKEWEARLIAHDVPFAPVLTMESLATHPQSAWLDMYEPEHNGHVLVRAPWRFAGQRPSRSTHVPEVGENSRDIAAEVMPKARIDDLIARGILVQSVA